MTDLDVCVEREGFRYGLEPTLPGHGPGLEVRPPRPMMQPQLTDEALQRPEAARDPRRTNRRAVDSDVRVRAPMGRRHHQAGGHARRAGIGPVTRQAGARGEGEWWCRRDDDMGWGCEGVGRIQNVRKKMQ